MPEIYHTKISYLSQNSWTSERGASKFLDQVILSTEQTEYGGYGCVVNGFKVTPGTGMSVNVNPATNSDGHCLIKYNNFAYLGWLEEIYNLTISGSDQASDRITLVVAYVDLSVTFSASDDIIEAPDVLKIVAIDGTPGSNPSAPSISQIQSAVGLNNPYIVLASIRVGAGTSTITDITDLTPQISAKLNPDIGMDPDNTYAAGFLQPDPNKGKKTRIVITGPNESVAAIPGIELVWLRKKR